MIVVIDDERTFTDPHFDFALYFRTSQDALEYFAKYITYVYNSPSGAAQPINEVWFDHDLGEKSHNDTTMVANFLGMMMVLMGEVELFRDTKIFIHTQNSVGGDTIKHIFEKYHKVVERVGLPACT